MKRNLEFYSALSLISSLAAPSLGFANVDPSSTSMKIYKFAVSASPLCTNPITVYSNDSPTSTDLLVNPTIGSGSLDAGTYPCVIMEVSKNLSYIPAADDGHCVHGTSYNLTICHDTMTSKLVDGTTVTCSGGYANDQRVAIYLTTQSTNVIGKGDLGPKNRSA